jgi:DNA-binding NarL/FixJ family response regulator
MIRVVIADDHTSVRAGLTQVLATDPELEVVGEARDGLEAMQLVRGTPFDVLLIDISMPGRSGLEVIRQIKAEKPKLRILVLSMHEEHQYAVRAIRSGASGYLTKDSASTQLISALRKVAAGGAWISAEVAEQLALGALPHADQAPHIALSDREFQVLRMLAAGDTVTDVAAKVNLSVKTVSTHKSRLMQKLGVSTNTELLRYAIQHRLTEDPSGGGPG